MFFKYRYEIIQSKIQQRMLFAPISGNHWFAFGFREYTIGYTLGYIMGYTKETMTGGDIRKNL